MVEPKRKYVDTEASYKKHLLSKASGPGGLLLITVVQARDLRSLAGSALLMKTASGHLKANIQKQCCSIHQPVIGRTLPYCKGCVPQ